MNAQSLHQLQPVRFNRLNANSKKIGYLFRILPFGDVLQYLPLSKRELLQFWIDISRLFLSRGDVGYLDPLPDSVPNRNRELVCVRRVEDLLGSGQRERKSASYNHWLTCQHGIQFFLVLAKRAFR